MSDCTRWNIEGTRGDIAVCKGYHDKGDGCDYETFTVEDAEQLHGIISVQKSTIATRAAAIEALREENERLKAALDLIINMDSQMFTLGDACSVAMKALQESNYE